MPARRPSKIGTQQRPPYHLLTLQKRRHEHRGRAEVYDRVVPARREVEQVAGVDDALERRLGGRQAGVHVAQPGRRRRVRVERLGADASFAPVQRLLFRPLPRRWPVR